MRPSPSPIGQQILIAVAALAAASCSSPQSSSSSGSATTSGAAPETTGGGTNTSSEGPWEDKIKAGQDREEMLTRDCWPKKSVWDGKPGATPAPSASATPVAPPHGAACPTIADLRTLGYTTPSQPTDRTGSVVTEGPVEWNEQCCYLSSHWHTGRPYVLDGAVTSAPTAPRSDWSGAPRRPTRADAARADAWLRDARLEHASVASFATFALDLLALGAPRALVEGAHRAAIDEIDHARRCFALASRFGGRDVGPGLLPVAAPRAGQPEPRTLVSVVRAALAEGCVGETAAALLAEAMLAEERRAVATEGAVAEGTHHVDVEATLAIIARDEANHASLAFAFIAWALGQDPVPVRRTIEATLASLDDVRARLGGPPVDGLEDARIGHAARAEVAANATRVVSDALASLLGPDPRC